MAMKYRFNADSHALAWVVAPVNSFGSASFTDIAIYVTETSLSGCQDSPKVYCCYSSGAISVSRCIMAASCFNTLIKAIFSAKMNKKKLSKIKQN